MTQGVFKSLTVLNSMMYDYVNLWLGKLICGLVLIKNRNSEAFGGIQDKKKIKYSGGHDLEVSNRFAYLAGLSVLCVLA